jgi:hypothetical protein
MDGLRLAVRMGGQVTVELPDEAEFLERDAESVRWERTDERVPTAAAVDAVRLESGANFERAAVATAADAPGSEWSD